MPYDAAALFREHHGSLFRYLVRLTADEDLARDAVQHAFLKLLEHSPDDTNPRAWLYRVATNAVRDWGRAERRHERLLSDRVGQVPGPEPETPADEQLELRRMGERVRAGLAALGERERTILLMREEGFAHREIAEAVGTTTGSVGTMIARALDKLARALPTTAGGQP
jgi:RNA polymerase sigma-70 factor (ECF subfamily)